MSVLLPCVQWRGARHRLRGVTRDVLLCTSKYKPGHRLERAPVLLAYTCLCLCVRKSLQVLTFQMKAGPSIWINVSVTYFAMHALDITLE